MAFDNAHPLHGLDADLGRPRTSPLYLLGLTAGTALVGALPVIYLGLIAAAGWGTVWFARTQTGLLEASSSLAYLMLRFALYLTPIACGAMLVATMLKSLFPGRRSAPTVIVLDRAENPMLFLFVERIARLVRAPAPARIEVIGGVDVYVRLGDGPLSLAGGDATLTVGMPLLRALSRAQLAGILAHELGHISQGAAMRMSWLVGLVVRWFWAMVYQDDGEAAMDRSMEDAHWVVQIPYFFARIFLAVVRGIVIVLMHAALALQMFLSRQMEFDADRAAIRLIGSRAFADTLTRVVTLKLAEQHALSRLGRLPADVSATVADLVAKAPRELGQDVQRAVRAGTTRWHDTHPSDKDRIAAAWRLSDVGAYQHSAPAGDLVRDLDRLGRECTAAMARDMAAEA